jgi:hypothetical protein
MQLIQSDMFEVKNHQSSSGKMFWDALTRPTTSLDAFLENLPEASASYSRQGVGGHTQVLCMVQRGQSPGVYWMPHFSVWPLHGGGYSFVPLDTVLEKHPPQKSYLSKVAMMGILRRYQNESLEVCEKICLAASTQEQALATEQT